MVVHLLLDLDRQLFTGFHPDMRRMPKNGIKKVGRAKAEGMSKVPSGGETAPDFGLADSTGMTRRLSDLASEGRLVLVFFRGWW